MSLKASPEGTSLKTARLLKEYLHDTPAATLDPRQLGELTDLFKELRDFLESAETSAMLGLAATELSAMNAGLGVLKKRASESIIAGLGDIRERYHELLAEDGGGYIDHVAAEGARKAQLRADETMAIVREAIGL